MANVIELVKYEDCPCFYFASCPTDGEHDG
jgi:hypothetical protein